MMRSLKSSKLLQPEEPASTMVVTPDSQREAVGIETVVAGVGSALAGAGEDVDVNVHQSRRDVVAGGIDHLEGVGRRDVGRDRRDLAVRDRDVANRADPVPAVDDVAAFQRRSYFCCADRLIDRTDDQTCRSGRVSVSVVGHSEAASRSAAL